MITGDWGYEECAVHVDLEVFSLKVGGGVVVNISGLEIKWYLEWEGWMEFMIDVSVIELT